MKPFLLLLLSLFFPALILTSCSVNRPSDEICTKLIQATGQTDCDSAFEALISGYQKNQQRLQEDLAPPILNDVVAEECVCSQETSNDVAPDIALPVLPTD